MQLDLSGGLASVLTEWLPQAGRSSEVPKEAGAESEDFGAVFDGILNRLFAASGKEDPRNPESLAKMVSEQLMNGRTQAFERGRLRLDSSAPGGEKGMLLEDLKAIRDQLVASLQRLSAQSVTTARETGQMPRGEEGRMGVTESSAPKQLGKMDALLAKLKDLSDRLESSGRFRGEEGSVKEESEVGEKMLLLVGQLAEAAIESGRKSHQSGGLPDESSARLGMQERASGGGELPLSDAPDLIERIKREIRELVNQMAAGEGASETGVEGARVSRPVAQELAYFEAEIDAEDAVTVREEKRASSSSMARGFEAIRAASSSSGDVAGEAKADATEIGKQSEGNADSGKTAGEPAVLSEATKSSLRHSPSMEQPSVLGADGSVRPALGAPGGNGAATDSKSVGLELQRPLDHPEWADELGQRLIWMRGKSVQAAEMRLNPPQLGPVEVRVQVHEDQTSVQFASSHAAVREAIESALPRLRELFNTQQLQLDHVEVAAQSFEDRNHSQTRQEQSGSSPRHYRRETENMASTESGQEGGRPSVKIGGRLLSLYA
ncbi:flagellar hook-length control protein FliK [Methylohalobius crimeensis]|uniref:flagellar hook-length control protein FliK n=1 Tax=Methylohalobius crimeensis TaxID=244365 RepID=UPI0003B4B2B1|nr:flagellar hook-length control protein FliK [Methylohalobius crimeensis]